MAAAVIVAAGYFLGGAAAETRKRAYAHSLGVLRLLYSLRAGIGYSRTDLFSVFGGFHDRALEECGFISALNSGALPAKKAWEDACACLSPQTPMLAEIRALGEQLGMSDAETQLELISGIVTQLEIRAEESRRELSTKAANFRLLGALAGCMAAIIIY